MKKIKSLIFMMVVILMFGGSCWAETVAEQVERIYGPFKPCPYCNDPSVTVVPAYRYLKNIHYNYCNKPKGGECRINKEKHTFENGMCTVCRMDEFYNNPHLNISYETDDAGRLIINIDSEKIGVASIERVHFFVDGKEVLRLKELSYHHENIKNEVEELRKRRAADLQLDFSASVKNPYAMIRYVDGNEVQIMWQRVALIINPGTELANLLGTGQHEFDVEIWKPLEMYVFNPDFNKCKDEYVDESPMVEWHKGRTTIETKFEGQKVEMNVDNTALKDAEVMCGICKVASVWQPRETMHVAVCKNNSSHILKVMPHEEDGNTDRCKVCTGSIKMQEKNIFSDYNSSVSSYAWSWKNVVNMHDKGIVWGTPQDNGNINLYPNKEITVEEAVALIARATGYKTNSDMEKKQKVEYNGFIPCNPEKWSAEECKYLLNKFGSNADKVLSTLLGTTNKEEMKKLYTTPITREGVAYLIGELLEERNVVTPTTTLAYKDWDKVKTECSESIAKVLRYGILNGSSVNGDLYIRPDSNITRVEAVALVDRLYCMLNK